MPSPTPSPPSPSPSISWHVPPEESGTRLDRFIKRRAPGLPVGLIQRLIRQRRVVVNDTPAIRNAFPLPRNATVLFPGDIKLGLDRGKKAPKPDDITLAEAAFIRDTVLHRDARCVVFNKPAGLPSQGGTGVGRHVEALLPGLGDGRYFLVHRLDKEVSGAMAVARDVGAAAEMADMFRKRTVEKEYWALVEGKMPAEGGRVRMDIDGKASETVYRVVQNLDGFGAWVALKPRTGRKHQLRVHCAMGLKCAIVGERKYGVAGVLDELSAGRGAKEGIASIVGGGEGDLCLHARRLAFPKLTKVHKGRGSDSRGAIDVTAPLPRHMQVAFRKLGLVERHGNDVDWN